MARATIKEYNTTRNALQEALQKATPDQQDYIQKYIESARNYSGANPVNNATQRDFETAVYKNALSYLNTGAVPVGGASTSTTNIFGGRNHREVVNDAGSVWNDFQRLNQEEDGYESGGGSRSRRRKRSSSGNGMGSYYLDITAGLDPGWAVEDDFNSRANGYISTVINNLQQAQAKRAGGAYLSNVANPDQIASDIEKLKTIQFNIDKAKDPKQVLSSIAGIVRKYTNDAAGFKSYFGDLWPGADQNSKNKQALEQAGYKVIDNVDFGNNKIGEYIRSKGYKIAQKGNDQYIINSDYSGPVTGASSAYMDTDWRGGNEGMGYAIDADGKFVFGDMNPYYADTNSSWYQSLSNYLAQHGGDALWQGNTSKYNQFTSLSDSDLLNYFAADLHNKNIADVSRYFDGQDVIVTAKGNNLEAYKSKYGHLRLDDPNLTFYYRTKDGGYEKGTYQQALEALGDITFNSAKAGKGLQNFNSIDYNLDGLTGPDNDTIENFDINGRGEWHNAFSNARIMVNGWNGEKTNSDHSMTGKGRGIDNNVGKFCRLMLYAHAEQKALGQKTDKESKELLKTYDTWMSNPNRKRDLIYLIYTDMQAHPEQYTDPRYRQAFQMILMTSKGLYSSTGRSVETIQQEKEGGILKAGMGAGLDVNGNAIPEDKKESIAASMRDKANQLTSSYNALQQRAAENGRDVYQQRTIEKNDWTASDTLRATALATDIVGLIGAITGGATMGVGSAVAVGSGFLSMAQDAIADFSDDKVSTGEAWKNVAINTGLAAGAFLGAKAPKIVKSVIKLVPKAVMVAAGAGVAFDPNVHNTIKRISEGKEMNVEDWRNVLLILRTATGIGTVGATEHGSKKALKRFDKAVAKEMKAQGLDGKQTTIGQGSEKSSLKSETAKEVESLLKSGKETEATQKIANELGITEDQAAKYLEEIPGARKWYKPWERKDSPGKRLITDNIDGEAQALPDDVMADVYDKALHQVNRKFAQAKKDHRLMNWADKRMQRMSFGLVKQQNYGANALMARAGVNNVKDLRARIKEQQSPVAAFDQADMDGKAIVAGANAERNAVRSQVANKEKGVAAVNKIFDAKEQSLQALRDQDIKNERALQAQGFVRDAAGKWHLNGNAGQAVSEAHTNMRAAEKAAVESQKKYDLAELRARQLRNNLKPEDLKQYTDLQSKATSQRVVLAKAVSAEQEFLKAHPELQMPTPNPDGTFEATSAAKADPRYKILVNDVQKAQKDMAATTSALEELFKKQGNKKIGKELQLFEDELRNATRENKSAQRNASKARAKFDAAKVQHDKEMARLDAARNKWKTKGIDIDNMTTQESHQKAIDDLKTKRTEAMDKFNQSYEKKLESRMNKYKSAHSKAILDQAQNVGSTRKNVEVTNIAGGKETIAKGAQVKSYQHLRNAEGVKQAYKENNPNAVELTREQAMKLVNTKNKGEVRGGFYDPTTNEVMVYQQGGKYSNLRK